MRSRLVDVSLLKKTKLWDGSLEQQAFKFVGVTLDNVRAKIAQLERCDDLTTNEKEYLSALKETYRWNGGG